jgi:hypothetical protein
LRGTEKAEARETVVLNVATAASLIARERARDFILCNLLKVRRLKMRSGQGSEMAELR